MKSVQLAKALSQGSVRVRTGKKVMGQIFIKFKKPGVKDKLVTPYPLAEQLKDSSYVDLSATYSSEDLKNSNLEDLIVSGALELKS